MEAQYHTPLNQDGMHLHPENKAFRELHRQAMKLRFYIPLTDHFLYDSTK